MQIEEVQRKLQASEAKRAKLVVELHQAQMALEQLAARHARFSNNDLSGNGGGETNLDTPPRGGSNAARLAHLAAGGSPRSAPMSASATSELANRVLLLESKLAQSEKARAELLKERENAPFGSNTMIGANGKPTGVTSLISVSESDADFYHDEEDDAREHARQVMSELVRAVHGQRAAMEESSALKLNIVELTNQIDAARQREAHLLKMISEYQRIFATTAVARPAGADDKELGTPVEQLGSSMQAARVKLLEARIQDLTKENASLRLNSASSVQSVVLASSSSNDSPPTFRQQPSRAQMAEAERLARMFALEQENADLQRQVHSQQVLLERLRSAILAAGLGGSNTPS